MQSKSMLRSFNEANECWYGIMDLVTDRLNCSAENASMASYHVPSSNYENVNIYISSNGSSGCNETKQQLHPNAGQHNHKADNVDDDVHIGVDFM